MLPKTLDEQISSLETLIAGKRGFQLGSFLLFVDSYLLLRYGINVLGLDGSWVSRHIGVGSAAFIVCFYFFVACILLPWIHFFLLFPSMIGSEIAIRKWAAASGRFAKGVNEEYFLQFAIIEDNAVAYQEYLRRKVAGREHISEMRWQFVFLCCLGLNVFAGRGASESLVEMLLSGLWSMAPWIYYPSAVALTLAIVMLSLGSLLAYRFIGRYYLFGPKLHQLIESTVFTDPSEETDLEADDET